MDYTIIEKSIKSNDGIHTVYGKIYIPIGTPKATLQIVHGMSEHIERYAEFMTFMAQKGFAVFAHDHLGHGRTGAANDELGFIAEENGDKLLIDDVKSYADCFLEDYYGIPHIVFGHSMGSFISRLYSEEYPENVDMLILSGTGGPQPLAPVGLAVTDLGSKLKGEDYKADLSQKLIFRAYNQNFKDENCEHSWLSRDKDSVNEYEKDEQCNYRFSVKSLNDLVLLSTRCNTDEWFENYRKDLPTLLISGALDPVGDNGHGVLEVYKRLQDNGVNDATLKLYSECRHELLNELNKDEVMNDILTWITNRI